MILRCVLCSSEGSRIEDIRDNVDLEGLFLADHPILLNIPENEPLPICEDCIASKAQPNMTIDPHSQAQSASIGSEELPVESESIKSNSLHSSIFENMDFTIVIDSEPIMQQVFETTHSEAAKKIKDVIDKPMPAQVRKRKIQEIVDAEFPNSKNKPVVRLNSREEQDNRKTYWRLVNMPGPVRRYKTSLSQSLSSNYSQSSSSSTMNNSDAILSSLIPSSQTTSPVQVSRPQIHIIPPQDLYEPDDSSDSNRSHRSNSKDRPANVQRDGNEHSNLGAPRRVHFQSPVTAKVLKKNLGG